jgi:hypothetical protein
MKRTVCFVFNPAFGQGNPDRGLEWIHQQLEPTFGLNVDCPTPEDQVHTLTTGSDRPGW